MSFVELWFVVVTMLLHICLGAVSQTAPVTTYIVQGEDTSKAFKDLR